MMDFLYLDTETTGLNPGLHEIVEVSWALGDAEPKTLVLPHDLMHAEAKALEINRYYERGLDDVSTWATPSQEDQLRAALQGAHIAGSNPAFDVAFLKAAGFDGWHHRLMDVPLWVAGKLDWPESLGLAKTAVYFQNRGYKIPNPDHSAGGDVLTTRAVHKVARYL
jgi:hypothetical protein